MRADRAAGHASGCRRNRVDTRKSPCLCCQSGGREDSGYDIDTLHKPLVCRWTHVSRPANEYGRALSVVKGEEKLAPLVGAISSPVVLFFLTDG